MKEEHTVHHHTLCGASLIYLPRSQPSSFPHDDPIFQFYWKSEPNLSDHSGTGSMSCRTSIKPNCVMDPLVLFSTVAPFQFSPHSLRSPLCINQTTAEGGHMTSVLIDHHALRSKLRVAQDCDVLTRLEMPGEQIILLLGG